MNELTGLEYLTKVMKHELSHAPMHDSMNMKIVDVRYGYIVYQFAPQACHINLQGGVHGGYYGVVLDSITGGAGHSSIDAHQKIVTVDLNIKMLRPLKLNQSYRGIGELVNAGKDIVVTQGKIVHENGELYAYGSAVLKKILR